MTWFDLLKDETKQRWTHLPAAVPGEPPAPIEQAYIELFVIPERETGRALNPDAERLRRPARRRHAGQEPVIGAATLVARTLERCVVVGEPGSGKSTLIQWLTWAVARRQLRDYDVPVVVKLSAYAAALAERPGLTPLEHFFGSLGGKSRDWRPAASWLRRAAAASRRALLLCDGWDEVPPSARDVVREQLLTEAQHFVTVITSRPSGLPGEFRDGARVEFYEIAGLAPRAAADLARRTLLRLGRADLVESVLLRLREDPDLRETAANPFLLCLLVRVLASASGRDTTAPRSLADVYSQIVAWMQHQHNRSWAPPGALEGGHLAALGRLAHGLLFDTSFPSYLFGSQELERCVAHHGVSATPVWRSRFINSADPGLDRFTFLHATLQEYLAAVFAADLPTGAVDAFLDRAFWSAARLIVLEFVAGLSSAVAERCRSRAAGWFQQQDRFHRVLLRLARVAAAGRWALAGPPAVVQEIQDALWRLIQAGEDNAATQAAVQASADLDPVALARRARAATGLDTWALQCIVDTVPRSVARQARLDELLQDPAWREYAGLEARGGATAEELAAFRAVLRDAAADEDERCAAAVNVGVARDTAAVPALVAILQEGEADTSLQEKAAESLGAIGGREAVDALVGLILGPLHPELSLVRAAVAQLRHGGRAEALDPAGRDRLYRQLAALPADDPRLENILAVLQGYPFQDGAEVVIDLACRAECRTEVRARAVRLLQSVSRPQLAERVTWILERESQPTVVSELVALAAARGVRLSLHWLEEAITQRSDDPGTELLAAYLRLAVGGNSPAPERVGAFLHGLIERALAPNLPAASSAPVALTNALSLPFLRGQRFLADASLASALKLLKCFQQAPSDYQLLQLLLALKVAGQFPSAAVRAALIDCLNRAEELMLAGASSPSAGRRGDTNGMTLRDLATAARAIANGVVEVAPEVLLTYPADFPPVRGALQTAALHRGWLVFTDRITDAEGRLVASVGTTDTPEPQAGQAGCKAEEPERDTVSVDRPGRNAPSTDGKPSRSEVAPGKRDEPGIERMGEDVVAMLALLIEFRRVGEVVREQATDRALSLKEIAALLVTGDTQFRQRMTAVSDFFRKYFQRYEGIEVSPDDEELPPSQAERQKLFERGQGRTFRIYALGWQAWELTCQYLDRIAPPSPRNA